MLLDDSKNLGELGEQVKIWFHKNKNDRNGISK